MNRYIVPSSTSRTAPSAAQILNSSSCAHFSVYESVRPSILTAELQASHRDFQIMAEEEMGFSAANNSSKPVPMTPGERAKLESEMLTRSTQFGNDIGYLVWLRHNRVIYTADGTVVEELGRDVVAGVQDPSLDVHFQNGADTITKAAQRVINDLIPRTRCVRGDCTMVLTEAYFKQQEPRHLLNDEYLFWEARLTKDLVMGLHLQAMLDAPVWECSIPYNHEHMVPFLRSEQMDYATWFINTTREAEALILRRFGNPNEPSTEIISDMMQRIPKTRTVTVSRRNATNNAPQDRDNAIAEFNPYLLGGYVLEPDLTRVAGYSGMGGNALKLAARERWDRLDGELKPQGLRIRKGDLTKARVETKAFFMACSDEWLKGLQPLLPAPVPPQEQVPPADQVVELLPEQNAMNNHVP